MTKKRIKKTWQAFLDALISDNFNWEAYFDSKTETAFSKALEVIHNAFKDNGIYDDSNLK